MGGGDTEAVSENGDNFGCRIFLNNVPSFCLLTTYVIVQDTDFTAYLRTDEFSASHFTTAAPFQKWRNCGHLHCSLKKVALESVVTIHFLLGFCQSKQKLTFVTALCILLQKTNFHTALYDIMSTASNTFIK